MPSIKDVLNRKEGLKLTDKQRVFVAEYLVDRDPKRAAIEAGYSVATAGAQGGKLLKHPLIAKMIRSCVDTILDKTEFRAEDVLQELAYCALRDPIDLCDENGILVTDLRLLPKRMRRTIDSIKQTVVIRTDEDGNQHKTVTNELKLVPKLGAIDAAMKHFGLYAPTKVEGEVNVNLNWDEFYKCPVKPVNVLPNMHIEPAPLPPLEEVKAPTYSLDEMGEPDV